MNTRIRVRSPRNRSVIEASEKFVAERRTRHDGGDAAEDRGGRESVPAIPPSAI